MMTMTQMRMPDRMLVPLPRKSSNEETDLQQKARLLRAMPREDMDLTRMSHVELVHLLEKLRSQYYALLGCEPEEDRVTVHDQWRRDMLRLKGKIQMVKECMAA